MASEYDLNQVNAPLVLWLIREQKARSIDDIVSLFPDVSTSSGKSIVRGRISDIIRHLVAAGLIEKRTRVLTTTPLLEKLQVALEFSLRDLSKMNAGSIIVSPLLGSVITQDAVTDVFVLMPLVDDLTPVYEDHIKRVALGLDLTVSRADDFFAPKPIISDIWIAIYRSAIIIADCTGRNANVFYEIGIAHALGRPTVLVSQDLNDIPFDLRHIRCIVYEYTPRGMTRFNEALRKALVTIKMDSTNVNGSRILEPRR